MLQHPPAQPGMREDEIDTPALIVDLDAFEYNLDHMAALLAPTGVKLRAHAKTHKSPVIAKLQMARGAVGQCAPFADLHADKTGVALAGHTGFDERGRPMRAPGIVPTLEGTLVYPGNQGGTNWYNPSYSPATGLFYIPTWENSSSTYRKGESG